MMEDSSSKISISCVMCSC